VLGGVVGVAAALLQGGDRVGQGIAYVGCFVALLGALLGGLVAILVDRPQGTQELADERSVTPPEQRASPAEEPAQ
jgi:hypothetical protein